MFNIFSHKPLTNKEWEKFEEKNAAKIAEQNAAEPLITDNPEMSFEQLNALLKNPPDETAVSKPIKP
jgi:hypothetical protein